MATNYKPPAFAGPVTPLPTFTGPLTPQTCAPDTLRLWNFLPQFIRDADAKNDYMFLSWLDGIGQQQQLIDTLCRVGTQGEPGWSAVLDVSRCPEYALPWLAQFVGVRFSGQQAGTSTAMRKAILAEGNFARGTTTAIQQAASPYLAQFGGYLNIIERYPTPYSMKIIVMGDLNDLTYRDLAAKDHTYTAIPTTYPYYSSFPKTNQTTVISAILRAVPAGIVVTITFY